MSLPQLQDNVDIVHKYLEAWGLLERLGGQRFVLLLDSFDEMQTPAHLCRANGNFTRWADHVLITGRTEAMPVNYLKDYFLPREEDSYELLQLSVAAFDAKQVEAFLNNYVQYRPEAVWKSATAYSDKLAAVPGLQQLTSTPFTLRMIVGILPALAKGATGNFTRSRLFDEYMRQAFDKENARLLTTRSGVGFVVPAFESYCRALALVILAGDTPNLATTQQLPPADEAVRQAAPIVKPSADTISFIHKSVWEYYASRAITHFVEGGSESGAVPPRHVVSDRGVLGFLKETVSLAKVMAWQDLVLASSNHDRPDIPARAAVALTVLCALHFGLHGRSFRGVRVPGAVLTGAHLRNSDFRGADLTGVDLRDADLTGVQLQEACMTKVGAGSPAVFHRITQ